LSDTDAQDVGTDVNEAPPAPQSTPKPEADPKEAEIANLKAEIKKLNGAVGGKQGYADQLKATLDDLQAKYSDETQTLQVKLAELETNQKSVSQQLAEKNARIAELEAATQAQETAKALRSKVEDFSKANEVPELVSMFEKNLMIGVADMDEEGLNKYLTEASDLFGGIKKQAAQDVKGGSAPPPPPGGTSGQKSMLELQTKLSKMSHTDPQYAETYAQYEQLVLSQE
jgi:uncharacterized phage infection (PIP) family protein YhgE